MNTIHSFAAFNHFLNSVNPRSDWEPFLFTTGMEDLSALKRLIRSRDIVLTDQIEYQLTELAKIRFPSEDHPSTREEFLMHLRNEYRSMMCYGNWAYLSWKNTLVHLLPENVYLEVITNRNQNKISGDEQLELRKKKVGVIGLSVGAEAAITIAQENLCGELRIADFDILDLSNLNRISAGVDELGLSKTLIAARKIKSMNPYLNLELFDNGVNENNMDEFLKDLDLVVEECDDLLLKYRIREEAKRRKINLVYTADERGFFSLEPYQYEGGLKPFHGLLGKTPRPREEYADTRDFMKALCGWLGGWENISPESRASVMEIGRSLCGYPQLASEARLAAAQVGHFARRLLLGEKLNSHYGNTEFPLFST